jgi:hypothetical protein
MDWFERLTGFREDNYELARSQLRINKEGRLVSLANRVSYGVGKLGLPSLRELREQIETAGRGAGGVTGANFRAWVCFGQEGAGRTRAWRGGIFGPCMPSRSPRN